LIRDVSSIKILGARCINSRVVTPKGPFPGSLIFDATGNLDGTSGGDGSPGAAFQLTPTSTGGWTYHLLHRFTGGNDGSTPNGPLIFDSAGNLYGTTGGGGVYGYGNVFRLTPNSNGGWTEHVLHQFTGGKQGAQPAAGLTHDATGNLYGTTYYGGNLSNCSSGCGVAFELTPNSNGGWKEIVLHTSLLPRSVSMCPRCDAGVPPASFCVVGSRDLLFP
jgi:hypothetical protein